eukprot:UN01242
MRRSDGDGHYTSISILTPDVIHVVKTIKNTRIGIYIST